MKRIGVILLCGFLLCSCGVEKTTDKSDKEKVVLEKREDEKYFTIEGDTLIKYKGGFEKSAEIVLPQRVRKIAKGAFVLSKSERKNSSGQLATVKLTIPSNVELEPYAFEKMGPMEVEFEEGRTKIEAYAFCGAINDGKRYTSKIKLPNSLKTLEKHCFDTEEWLIVNLGDGIEKIEDYALNGCDWDCLPSSLRAIGKRALGENGELTLPEGVERIGYQAAEELQVKVKIPSSVKSISPGAFVWSENAEEEGYVVDKQNRNYKNDEHGALYSKDGKILYFATFYHTAHLEIPDGVEVVYKEQLYTTRDSFAKVSIRGLDKVKIKKIKR